MHRPDRRGGFAMPIAIAALITLALASSLMVDGAIGTMHAGSALFAESRVALLAESALASALVLRFDSTAVTTQAGATIASTLTVSGSDTTSVLVRSLGAGIAMVTATATSRRAGFRVLAGRMLYAVVSPASAPPFDAQLIRLPSNWWVAFP
jgi:hypothetical protein